MSGRRTLSEQANAMAVNVVKERQYIVKTYADTAERAELQKWVDDHPEAKTKEAIAKGLLTAMESWTPEQIRRITYHVTGDAFDIAPVGGDDGKEDKGLHAKTAALRQVSGQGSRSSNLASPSETVVSTG